MSVTSDSHRPHNEAADVTMSRGDVLVSAGHLLDHLRRAGVRFLPNADQENVSKWSRQFAHAWDVEDGKTESESTLPGSDAPRRVSSSAPPPLPKSTPRAAEPDPAKNRLMLVPAVTAASDRYPGVSLPIAQRQESLDSLAQTVAACTRCDVLAKCRTQTVFGEGNPSPRFVFFGEGPGAEEDKTGRPFVGEDGRLLTKMITACRLSREDVYLLNTVKCRPPGSRNPEPGEIDNCREYYQQQLQILRPEYIICLGSVPSKTLLGSKLSIGRLRQRFHQYHDSKVLITYHPVYLLRNPEAKKAAWADLQLLMKDAGL